MLGDVFSKTFAGFLQKDYRVSIYPKMVGFHSYIHRLKHCTVHSWERNLIKHHLNDTFSSLLGFAKSLAPKPPLQKEHHHSNGKT